MKATQLLVLAASLLWTAGCKESLTGPGACPAYCPATSVDLVDTALLNGVSHDTAVRGYVAAHRAASMQLAFDPAVGVVSRAVIRFQPFASRMLLTLTDTIRGPVVSTDSLRLQVTVTRRRTGVQGLELEFFRLFPGADSTVTFASLDPFFHDSMRVGMLVVPDSFTGGPLQIVFGGNTWPIDAGDSTVAVGVIVRGPSGGFLELGAIEGGSGPILSRFAQVDSSGTLVRRSVAKVSAGDLYVSAAAPPPVGTDMIVGGVPAARTLMRFAVPASILGAAEIVRATLILVPLGPVTGAPGDSITILANAVTADVGPKSPLGTVAPDSLRLRSAHLPVGTADSVFLDVTDAVRSWGANPDRPRTLIIRALVEGTRLAEFRFAGRTSALGPALRVTYVRPIDLGAQ